MTAIPELEPESTSTDIDCSTTFVDNSIVPVSLLILSFSTLIVKRYLEKPRRSWTIWLLDVSKQGFSLPAIQALTAWLYNSKDPSEDPCAEYFMTILLNTVLGTLFSVSVLSLCHRLFIRYDLTSLRSGNYFKMINNNDPITSLYNPRKVTIDFKAWSVQFALWLVIAIISQVMVGCLFNLLDTPLIDIGKVVLAAYNTWKTIIKKYRISWIPMMELICVALTVLIGTTFQMWTCDNFLKKKEFSKDDLSLQGRFFDADLSDPNIPLSKSDNNSIVLDSIRNSKASLQFDTYQLPVL